MSKRPFRQGYTAAAVAGAVVTSKETLPREIMLQQYSSSGSRTAQLLNCYTLEVFVVWQLIWLAVC